MLERIIKFCKKHGDYEHVTEKDGYLRCRRCRNDNNFERRRGIKRKLIKEAGGKCIKCGYDKCAGVLEFHHLDPKTKSFNIGKAGNSMSLFRLLEEIKKCILLCANCHREIECNYVPVINFS